MSGPAPENRREVRHGDLTLALHVLAERPGPRLLLLHEIHGRTRLDHAAADAWPGPVLGLDLSGHGRSRWRPGASYTPEVFVADVDAVLAEVGACVLCGEGLGAWVAFLAACARPDAVPAALLAPGAGLEGGGERPGRLPPAAVEALAGAHAAGVDRSAGSHGGEGTADPMVAICLRDARPLDYVAELAPAAGPLLLWEDGGDRPAWWASLRERPRTTAATPRDWREALAELHRLATERPAGPLED